MRNGLTSLRKYQLLLQQSKSTAFKKIFQKNDDRCNSWTAMG